MIQAVLLIESCDVVIDFILLPIIRIFRFIPTRILAEVYPNSFPL